MSGSVPMNRAALLVSLAVALAAAGPALAAAPVADPGRAEVESLVREAAQLEKTDCEAAYLKYQAAGEKLSEVADKPRRAELQAIFASKSDKLLACYGACQPSDRQRELLEGAKSAAAEEPKRATQMVRRLLVGKNEKCQFWAGARAFQRTLPAQGAESDDNVDPCEVTPEVQAALTEAHAMARRERDQLTNLDHDRGRLTARMAELVDLYRAMDATRVKLFELREQYLDCDKVYRPLAQEGDGMRDAFAQTQELVLATYKGKLASLSRKLKDAQAEISQQQEELQTLPQLKKQLDDLGGFNEKLYDELFDFAGAEAISFSVKVEGRRVEQPIEDVRALMASESKTMAALEQRYPEYFKDGVNLEALKRKKLVLEKLQQMLQRVGPRADKPLYARALGEVGQTIQMMDKAISSQQPVPGTLTERSGPASSSLPWLLGGGTVLLVAGLTWLRMRANQ